MTLQELQQEHAASLAAVAAATETAALDALRVKYLGRNGLIPGLVKQMKDVPPADRPAFGKELGAWRAAFEQALAEKTTAAQAAAEPTAAFDVTLPGRWRAEGVIHPVSRVIEEASDIFHRLGFTVADGPDIETKFNNFTALNTAPHHPSMDPSDTFWFDPELLLRTQTSAVQTRTMLANPPPVRIVCPGRCYRRDTMDATHSANFHQIEGLYVDSASASARTSSPSPSPVWRSTSPATSARARAAASARIPVGLRLPVPAWSTPASTSTWATTPTRSTATPSAWASSASP